MAIYVAPLSSIEDGVYGRLIAAIPEGDFYLRAQHVQPRHDGANTVTFVINGTVGHTVEVYLNDAQVYTVGLSSTADTVSLTLQPPPDINYVTVIDVDTLEQASTSVVVTNYGTVLYGAALDYFRHDWLPLQYQRWSLLSEWSSRLTEFYYRYHKSFPDAPAIHTLAVRLCARATWNGLPTDLGVRSMVSALTCCEPVISELTNSRPSLNLALYPLLPISADYGGSQFDIWLPDIATSREHALLKLCRANDVLTLKAFREGHTFLTVNDEPIDLYKDGEQLNLNYVLRQIGTMDYMRAWVGRVKEVDNYRRFWCNPLDSIVEPPGLGCPHPFGQGFDLDTGATLDSNYEEPWSPLWDGVTVGPLDDAEWDSVVTAARSANQIAPIPPSAWEWEYTAISGTCSTTLTLPNPTYGGASPDFEYP